MIRKTLLLGLLIAATAIATQAFSQSAQTTSSGSPSDKASPAAEKSPAAPSTTSKPGDAAPAPSKTLPPAAQPQAKAESSARPQPSAKSDSPAAPVKSTSANDASKSKAIPTSSAFSASASSTSSRKELVVDAALVTLIYDNKVPASEAGMLMEVPVEEGTNVEKGALVAQIDSRATLAKQKIAEAELAAAQAQSENDAEVIVAEKAVEVSKADLDSIEEIRKKSKLAVSETEWRKNWFQWQKSVAQVTQATSEKHIAGLTANAKRAQHEAATIELDLRQARSPFKGQVVEVMKKPGDWVTVGEPIAHIVGLDRVRVKGFVEVSGPNGASHDEVIDKPVTIVVDAPGGKKHSVKGIIGFASPVIDGAGTNRHFRVWADVDNEKTTDPVTKRDTWKIQPGSRASMTIDITPPKPAPPARPEPSKGGKGKVDAFKPVTGEADKSGVKKKAREF